MDQDTFLYNYISLFQNRSPYNSGSVYLLFPTRIKRKKIFVKEIDLNNCGPLGSQLFSLVI